MCILLESIIIVAIVDRAAISRFLLRRVFVCFPLPMVNNGNGGCSREPAGCFFSNCSIFVHRGGSTSGRGDSHPPFQTRRCFSGQFGIRRIQTLERGKSKGVGAGKPEFNVQSSARAARRTLKIDFLENERPAKKLLPRFTV